MDWLHQDKFRNWLILLLLVLNIITVSIIWVQMSKDIEPGSQERGVRPAESVNLMKRVLDLDEAQAAVVDSAMAAARAQTKPANNRLSTLKRQIAEEVFKDNPDTSVVKSAAAEIGELQATIELLRFQRFRDIVATCTPEQREKLKPVVIEAFGRKPPKEELAGPKPTGDEQDHGREGKRAATDRPKGDRPPPPDGKPAPPSMDEKLGKYANRLSLSEDQIDNVRKILQNSRKDSEELRARANPDPGEIDAAKEHIRKREDVSIMKILDAQQKAEFERMIAKRRK
jgi:Spy/CpxP family protein refolding chaperone